MSLAGDEANVDVMKGWMVRSLRVAHFHMVPVNAKINHGPCMLLPLSTNKTISPDAHSDELPCAAMGPLQIEYLGLRCSQI